MRSDAEVQEEGAIRDAQHLPITQVAQHLDAVPRQPLHIFCGSGSRSTIVASLLEREGWRNLTVVLGGTRGWTSVSCPIDLVQRA